MPITETIKKGQIKRKVSASEVEVLHPETEAELVIYDNTTSELVATDVQAAIDEVAAAIAEAGKVDDVKIQVDSGTPASIVSNKIATIPVTSSYSGTSETIVNGKAIKAALDGLTDTLTGTPGAGKTITAFDEAGGKVTATFSDIQITESQVTNLTTDLASKLDDSQLKTSWSSTVSDSNIPSEKLVKNTIDTVSGNKVDKLTTSGLHVYSHTGSTQSEIAVDTAVTQNSSNLVTSGAVWTAIDNLPEPMVFKGSVGDSGTTTWANLPTAAAANEGHTYKVITAHAADAKCPAAKVGDTIISNGSAWVVIPSGDEPSGTVTSVGLSLPSSEFTVTNSPVTSSGTLTGAWKTQAANKVFAGPASGSAAAPTFRSIVAADLPVASQMDAGIVTTGAQNFAGTKTFASPLIINNIVLSDTGTASTGETLDISDLNGTGGATKITLHGQYNGSGTGSLSIDGNGKIVGNKNSSQYEDSGITTYLKLPEKGTSSAYATIATTDDIPSISLTTTAGSEAINVSSDSLNVVTRDTAQAISGSKTFTNTIHLKGSDTSSELQINSTSNGYQILRTGPYTESLGFTTNGLSVSATDGKALYPSTSAKLDLGNSSSKWKDLYLSGNLSDGTNSTTIANIVAGLTTNVKSGKKSDGSTDISGSKSGTIITLGDSGVTAGTYSAIQVNAKGIAVAGGQILDVIAHGGTPNVVNGGWYFEEAAA